MEEQLLSSTQAARELGIYRTTTFRAAASGLVPGARREPRPGAINAPWVANRRAWQQWYATRRPPGRPPRAEFTPEVSSLPPQVVALVRPTEPKTETVAEINIDDNRIMVIFPEYRDDFRKLIRFGLGYRWNRQYWIRKIGPLNGLLADRAAETGHRLLAGGFPIRIHDSLIRARAIAGDYQPEPKRWVSRLVTGTYKDWFCITWPYEEDYYATAKRIAGSRYVPKQGIAVPAEHFDEVLDFAEIHEFHVSPGAQKLAEEARAIREAALVVRVPPPKKRRATAAIVKAPLQLEAPDEVNISDDLRDDDETP